MYEAVDSMLLLSALEDLDRTQPHQMTKLLKTGWVMILILIRGTYLIHIAVLIHVYFLHSLNKFFVCTRSVEEVTVGIKRTVMLALVILWAQRKKRMTSSTMPCLLFTRYDVVFWISGILPCIFVIFFCFFFSRVGAVLLLELASLRPLLKIM